MAGIFFRCSANFSPALRALISMRPTRLASSVAHRRLASLRGRVLQRTLFTIGQQPFNSASSLSVLALIRSQCFLTTSFGGIKRYKIVLCLKQFDAGKGIFRAGKNSVQAVVVARAYRVELVIVAPRRTSVNPIIVRPTLSIVSSIVRCQG